MHPVEGDVCGACGHSVELGELPRGALPMGTVVAERFELGQCLSATYQSLGYIAWDTKGRHYVMVTEFYPKFVASRVDNNVVAKKNGALFEQARQMYFASHEEQGATLLMSLIANNTAYRVYALSCTPADYATALEEVMDHPVLFRNGDRPLMSVNALSIPEFPHQRSWKPSNRTLRMKKQRKIRTGIIAACALLVIGGTGIGCYWYTRPQQVMWDIQSKSPVVKIAIVDEKNKEEIYQWPADGSEALEGEESWRDWREGMKLHRGDYRIEVTNEQETWESATLHVPQEEPLVLTLAEKIELKEKEWLYQVQGQRHIVGEDDTDKIIAKEIEIAGEPRLNEVTISFSDDIQEYQFYLQREETPYKAKLDASWITQDAETSARVMKLEVLEGNYSLLVSKNDADSVKVKDITWEGQSYKVDMEAIKFYWDVCAKLEDEDARLLTVGEQTKLLAGDEDIPVEMYETWVEEYPELMQPYLEARKQQIAVDISFTSDLKAEVKENATVIIEGMPWHEGDVVQATVGHTTPYHYSIQFQNEEIESGTFAAQDGLELGAAWKKKKASYADVRQVALIEGKYWFFYDDERQTGTRDDYEALLQTARNFDIGVNLEKLNEKDAVRIPMPEKIKEDKVKAACVKLGNAKPIELDKEILMREKELVVQTSFAPEEIVLELTMKASEQKTMDSGNPIVEEQSISFGKDGMEQPELPELCVVFVMQDKEMRVVLPENESECKNIKEAYKQKEWWGNAKITKDLQEWNLEEIPFDERLSEEWKQGATFSIDGVEREFKLSDKLLLTKGTYTFTFDGLPHGEKSYQVTIDEDDGINTWSNEKIGVATVDEWLKDTALVIIQREGKPEEKKRLGENAAYMNTEAWTQSNFPTRKWEVRNEAGKPMDLILPIPSGSQSISLEAGESLEIEVISADAGDGWKPVLREEDAKSYQLNYSEDGVHGQIIPNSTPVPTVVPTQMPTQAPTQAPTPTPTPANVPEQATINCMKDMVISDGLDGKNQTESPHEAPVIQEQQEDKVIYIDQLQGADHAGEYHQRIREGMMVYCTITRQTLPEEKGNNSVNKWNNNVELLQKKIPLIIQSDERIVLRERPSACPSLTETELINFLQCLMNPEMKEKTTADGIEIYSPYTEMTWEEVLPAWKDFYYDWKYEQEDQSDKPQGIV